MPPQGVSTCRVHGKRTNIRLLVCTANLGNEQPDALSMAKFIPPDGYFVEESVPSDVDDSVHSLTEDEEPDLSEHSAATPYQSKYPVRYHDSEAANFHENNDESKDNNDEDYAIMMNALSKQLDLIVVGLQEATFDPPKNESMSEGSANGRDATNIRIRVPMVKPLRKLKTLRAAKDFSTSSSNKQQEQQQADLKTASSLSSSNPVDSTGTKMCTVRRDEWEDGTHALHSLFEGRLPSYTRLVSYQRGQMRLLVFGRTQSPDPVLDPPLPLQVLHTAAQNTGRAGLANKGGIVTEILVNCSTRLSFVSCHLEAHEGQGKYAVRCETLADILRGTAPRKKVFATTTPKDELGGLGNSAHHVTPSLQSAHPSHHTAIDVSLTAHYSFVLGDLNFRTDLSFMDPGLAENDEVHKQSVRNIVAAQDWETLNSADELHRALLNKHCLVGFRTLFCNFPPTFKVERQKGYEYVEKRRPSYTDRVLFKTGHELEHGLKPILYEPIDDFSTSDHKPVRAAFSVDLNPSFRVRPRAVRGESMRWATSNNNDVADLQRRRLLPRLFRRPTDDDDDISVSSSASVVDLGHGQGLGRAANNLQLFVSNMTVILKKADGSSHGGPCPYVMLTSQPEEALRSPSFTRGRKWKRFLNRLAMRAPVITDHTKEGWPCSSLRNNTYTANWNEEEIACQILTHTPEGGSMDLSGAVLYLTVMNGNAEDSLLGTVCFNLANLLRTATANKNLSPGTRSLRRSLKSSSAQLQTHHRRVRRKSVLGSIFGSRQRRSGSERGSGGIFSFARNEMNDVQEDEEDPITAVAIHETLLKDGIEVGTLSCTIEAWWMDEATAKIVRIPALNHLTPVEGSSGNSSYFWQKHTDPQHHKAERRAGFRQDPR